MQSATYNAFKIHFNIILLCTPRLACTVFPSGFPMHISMCSHANCCKVYHNIAKWPLALLLHTNGHCSSEVSRDIRSLLRKSRMLKLSDQYKGADKSLARPGRKQANVSVRMTWIPSAPCLAGKETWWQLASRCWWNDARPWHASELVSFLVGLRTYQHTTVLAQYKEAVLPFSKSYFQEKWRKEQKLTYNIMTLSFH